MAKKPQRKSSKYRCAYCGRPTNVEPYKAGPYLGYPCAYPHSPTRVDRSVRPLCDMAMESREIMRRMNERSDNTDDEDT